MNVDQDLAGLAERLDGLSEQLQRIEESAHLDAEQRERAVALQAQCDLLRRRLHPGHAGGAHPVRDGLHDDWVALKRAFETWSAGLDARFEVKDRRGLN